jgi:hypothetical protein
MRSYPPFARGLTGNGDDQVRKGSGSRHSAFDVQTRVISVVSGFHRTISNRKHLGPVLEQPTLVLGQGR